MLYRITSATLDNILLADMNSMFVITFIWFDHSFRLTFVLKSSENVECIHCKLILDASAKDCVVSLIILHVVYAIAYIGWLGH